MATMRITYATLPFAIAALAAGPANAWEVVRDGLPTFAAVDSFTAGSGGALDAASPLKFEAVKGWSPGYDVRMGKYLFGMEQKTGFAAGGDMLGLASGVSFSRTNMKFGYDMGAFKPYMTAAFAETKAPAFGANIFAAPPGAATPFAFSSQATSVGAGFDYSITDNLSFGMSVNATQFSGWRR